MVAVCAERLRGHEGQFEASCGRVRELWLFDHVVYHLFNLFHSETTLKIVTCLLLQLEQVLVLQLQLGDELIVLHNLLQLRPFLPIHLHVLLIVLLELAVFLLRMLQNPVKRARTLVSVRQTASIHTVNTIGKSTRFRLE